VAAPQCAAGQGIVDGLVFFSPPRSDSPVLVPALKPSSPFPRQMIERGRERPTQRFLPIGSTPKRHRIRSTAVALRRWQLPTGRKKTVQSPKSDRG
jgi:hypothetical protein